MVQIKALCKLYLLVSHLHEMKSGYIYLAINTWLEISDVGVVTRQGWYIFTDT